MGKIDLKADITLFSRVSLRDKVFLSRQLATMLGSGVAVDQSFKILLTQTKNPLLKKAYEGIIKHIEQGHNLSTALAEYRNIFDPVFISVVRSGEGSGQLDKVLIQLADRLETSQEFNSKVKSALVYPIFIFVVMIVILALMMIYVVPPLKQVFGESGVQLPLTTRVVIAISDFTLKFWWAELAVLAVLLTGGFFFFKTDQGGSTWDRAKIKVPGIRDLYTQIYMARFCRTMAMLIHSGVPIIETISITSDVIQNRVYSSSLKTVITQVERGIPMSVPLSKDKNFPVTVSQMILVGEQTGQMETVLNKLADFYEKETATMIKGMAGLIEPLIIVIMGMGVGFLVFSMIYPIYSVSSIF